MWDTWTEHCHFHGLLHWNEFSIKLIYSLAVGHKIRNPRASGGTGRARNLKFGTNVALVRTLVKTPKIPLSQANKYI